MRVVQVVHLAVPGVYKSRTAAARAAPLGPALWRAQPGSCRGPFGGCLRGRQHLHLHLHTLPCLHLHLPGTAHRPLHLHFFGRACLSPSRRDAPPSSASSARQARHVGFSPPPPPPSSMLDSMESLTALATSSLETSLFRPWPPRARRPSTPPPARQRPPGTAACAPSPRTGGQRPPASRPSGFARSFSSALTASSRRRRGAYLVLEGATSMSACSSVSRFALPPAMPLLKIRCQ